MLLVASAEEGSGASLDGEGRVCGARPRHVVHVGQNSWPVWFGKTDSQIIVRRCGSVHQSMLSSSPELSVVASEVSLKWDRGNAAAATVTNTFPLVSFGQYCRCDGRVPIKKKRGLTSKGGKVWSRVRVQLSEGSRCIAGVSGKDP